MSDTKIPVLDISPDFTIEDIHKIREYNYEMTKNMSSEEMFAYYNDAADRVKKEIQKIREEKTKNIGDVL